MTPSVSLYIPCFNVEAYIAPVIEGVLRQTLPPDEILIVDDGSTDHTLEIARRYPVTIVRHDQNRGLAAARNTGLHRAKNEFVAALDADCVPDSAWLETLVATVSEPKMAIAGGKLIETVLTSVADRWRQSHMPQDWGEMRVVNPKFTFGSNTVARKSAIEEIGWYDERMRTNGEDVDISRRLRVRGYDGVYEPRAIVRHLRHDSVASVMNAYWRWWRFGVKAYANGARLSSMAATFYRAHFRTSFLQCAGQDLRQRKFDLLPLDAFMLCYLPYRDLRLYFEPRAKTRGSQLSSEVKTP
ncbi:MAG: glycosyltransferase family 2 protein [Candidatus Acidiferrales bacterium]|jgi:glycosyltransferase involved in cell wall biosynthesis